MFDSVSRTLTRPNDPPVDHGVGSANDDSMGHISAARSCSALYGEKLVNRRDETLGLISDVWADIPRGRLIYALVTVGGFMGLGERHFPIPWAAITYDADHHLFVLNADGLALEKAPNFDRAHWPDPIDLEWQVRVHRYYGVRPYWWE